MSSRNVLLVALDPVSEEEIHDAIERRKTVDDVNVHIVAPAANIGPLQWLMADEDEARAEAGDLAEKAAHAVEDEAHTEMEVGDTDPVVAVQDALADFPADEIVLAGPADEEVEAKLRRFGLPVERLDGGEEGVGDTHEVAREITRGRSGKTPLVVITGVGVVILGAAALLSLLLFLVIWLV